MSDYSMLDLYKQEVEVHAAGLNQGLLALEENVDDVSLIEPVMRAAHSLKGAARILSLEAVARVAHVLEDIFVAISKQKLVLSPDCFDILYQSVDFLSESGKYTAEEMDDWLLSIEPKVVRFETDLKAILSGNFSVTESVTTPTAQILKEPDSDASAAQAIVRKTVETHAPGEVADSVVRVSADNLNRLMGLAAESLVEAGQYEDFRNNFSKVKARQTALANQLEALLQDDRIDWDAKLYSRLEGLHQLSLASLQNIRENMESFDAFTRRSSFLSDRLYREVLTSRMRPFSDGVEGFPRLVRDVAQSLKKKIKLSIEGEETLVDRDILGKLEAPLNHLIRNACDHGIERPEVRSQQGKPVQGSIKLNAYHSAGMLVIEIHDDGCGIDVSRMRERIVEKELVTEAMAQDLNDDEVLDFLFLPGFSTRSEVTDLSGRGVGLDVVMNVLQESGGGARIYTQLNEGTTFVLKLPITRSVIRALLVTIDNELYAFPLSRIMRTVRLSAQDLFVLENKQYFSLEGQNVGLVAAEAVLGLAGQSSIIRTEIDVVVVRERNQFYGIEVGTLSGEVDLVVRPLDARLGKVPSVSSVALSNEGAPILVLDVEDLIQSVDKLLETGHLDYKRRIDTEEKQEIRRRVLVVDDSLTVRETERQLLENAGYVVEIAVDGVDGWNAVRLGEFDLIVTDIDMPRMNGYELVSKIRKDARLQSLPIVIVSYKDREADRIKGMEAGADCYLTKGSFKDETFIETIVELIGAAIVSDAI